MTDVEYHRSRYDPPKPKGILGVPPGVLLVSLLVVSILFGILAFYFINAQFKLREVNYSDDAVDVEIIEPVPPPPPPPDTPPPPKLQVRPPAVVPTNIPVPPVNLEPTKKEDRIENTAPPVITPDPPRPAPLPAPPPPSVIRNPTWSRQPQADFPERAQSRGIERGRVSLDCMVNPNGSMTDCRITSEDPAGAGFGQAALSAARRARVSPREVNGAAVGARVTFNMTFVLPDE